MKINCHLTAQVVAHLQANNIDCYLVGGYVRDSILGIDSKDIDIELHNTDIDTAYNLISEIAKCSVFGTFGVVSLSDVNTEFAIARTETKVGNQHTSFVVDFITNGDLKLAAARRDFTINSMMYDLQNNQLLDFYGGQADLAAGILRHVSPAFSEDPLRILRGVKFICRYDLTIASDTNNLCLAIADQLKYLPKSRIENELNAIFSCPHLDYGLKLLTEYLNVIFNQQLTSFECPIPRIKFFGQFTDYQQVIDFCFEHKKTKKDLLLILDNYQQIVNFHQLASNQQFELLNLIKYVTADVFAINRRLEYLYNEFEQLLVDYNGSYFIAHGFTGKQIAIEQKKLIGGMINELSNSN